MARFISSFVACLLFTAGLAVAQSKVKLQSVDAPSLHIRSIPVSVEGDIRRITLSLEVENTGEQTITGFAWEYRTRGVIRGNDCTFTAHGPDVDDLIAAHEVKMIRILDNMPIVVPPGMKGLPIGEINITKVTFADGSSWTRTSSQGSFSPK